jgi:type IV secretory pathway TraG/TraD family ATPase VirD4
MIKQPRSTYGFEILFNDLRMFKKMLKHILMITALLQLALFCVSFVFFFGVEQTIFLLQYYSAKVLQFFLPKMTFKVALFGEPQILTLQEIARYTANTQVIIEQSIQSLIHSCTAFVIIPFLFKWFKSTSENKQSNQYIRGAEILTSKNLKKSLKSSGDTLGLKINDDISLPVNAETKHFMTIGKTGTGKTQLIGRIIQQLKNTNQKLIVYDFKGDFLEYFYDENTDLIFNPLDARTLQWNVFNDIQLITDLEIISKALIPIPPKGEVYFIEGARDVFYGLLLWCWNNNSKSNAAIWEACSQNTAQTKMMIEDTPGAERALKYFDSDKTAASVLSTMMQYVKIFQYMGGMSGDFSVTEWVKNGNGTIFITSNSTLEDTLRPVISLFIDLASTRLLSLSDTKECRLRMFIDEFATLHKLNSISKLLNVGRSKGSSVWLGFQSLGQLNDIYGENQAEAIVNGCASSFMFGLSSPTTAEHMSKKIGEYEEYEVDSNSSYAIDTGF